MKRYLKMIRKVFSCAVFIFCNFLAFSKDLQYTVKKESNIYEYSIKNGFIVKETINKNDFVKIDYYPYSSSIDFYDNEYFISIIKNNQNLSLLLFDLIPKDTDELIQEEYITKIKDEYVWIPSYYLEVIEKKDREIIRKYEKELVKRYSDYIRYPIKMEIEKSVPKEGTEGKEYEKVIEIETLNSMIPIWKNYVEILRMQKKK